MMEKNKETKRMLRVDRMLSEMGCGSRSDIKKAVKAGRVKLVSEGKENVLKDPSLKIFEGQELIYEEQRIRYEKYQYFILNKPAGLICDRMGARQDTVFKLFEKPGIRTDLSACGRLDKDTEGLLILTNDGAFLHRMISPSSGTEKEYEAELDGELYEEEMERMRDIFKRGFYIPESEKGGDGFTSRPASLEFKTFVPPIARVTVTEGRYHQVRRMFKACGHEVVRLKRIREGDTVLPEGLSEGCWIRMSPGNEGTIIPSCNF